jgi:hypothetical protein
MLDKIQISWQWCINAIIKILEIIHRFVFILNRTVHNVQKFSNFSMLDVLRGLLFYRKEDGDTFLQNIYHTTRFHTPEDSIILDKKHIKYLMDI